MLEKEALYSEISKMQLTDLQDLAKFVDTLTDAEYRRRQEKAWSELKKAIEDYESIFNNLELYDPDSDRYYMINGVPDSPSPISIYEV